VEIVVRFERRDEVADISDDEQVARSATGNNGGHLTGVTAPNEEGLGILPLLHEPLESLFVLSEFEALESFVPVSELL
jgi:hypothetical protein